MTLCTFWSHLEVRINIVTDKSDDDLFVSDRAVIKELIDKYRLPYYAEPRVIRVRENNPSKGTIAKFERLAQCQLEDATRNKVVSRWLRLSELIGDHSKETALSIATLPVPSDYIEPLQYMAILNVLSDQKVLPPMILMRGNGRQILTFDSE